MSFSDPYEVVLADLRAKRDEIDNLIRSLEAFRPAQATAPTLSRMSDRTVEDLPPPKRIEAVGPLYGLSIVDASKLVLRERGVPMPVADIVTALKEGGHVMNSEDPANTVSSVLNRALAQGNGVVRIGRGVWALPETTPRNVEEQAAQGLIEAARPGSGTTSTLVEAEFDEDIPF